MEIIFSEQQRLPIKCWTTGLEEGTKLQALNLSNLPFALALMPERHQGFGMPNVIIPNAVGVDKDIYEVMLNQNDLVEIITKLEPLGVIKA